MTRAMRHRRRRELLRAFGAGAAVGLISGAVLTVLIVWRYSGPIGPSGPREPTAARSVLDDVGGVVVESEEKIAATAGSTVPNADASEAAVIGPEPSSPGELAGRDLEIPVEGAHRDDLTPTFSDLRGGSRRHEALDIVAPRNTPVKAVEDGTIARLFHSKAGGITIYQFDPTARFCYYYAHLERYADGLREGDRVTKGQTIGFVGTSGNAPSDTPHLHFAIFRLTAEKRWWEGTPIDPYEVLR